MVNTEMRGQTQEGNHTTSFIAGNSKVGTDLVAPFTLGFLGYDLYNSPKISMFLGEEA